MNELLGILMGFLIFWTIELSFFYFADSRIKIEIITMLLSRPKYSKVLSLFTFLYIKNNVVAKIRIDFNDFYGSKCNMPTKSLNWGDTLLDGDWVRLYVFKSDKEFTQASIKYPDAKFEKIIF